MRESPKGPVKPQVGEEWLPNPPYTGPEIGSLPLLALVPAQ